MTERRIIVNIDTTFLGTYLTEASTWEEAVNEFFANVNLEPVDEDDWNVA